MASPTELLNVKDTFFDISTFQVTLPATLDASCRVDMNGLRFYGGQAYASSSTGYTFGSSSDPTYVLIGLVGPTFTPMLLVYGTVSLSNNNSGVNYDNAIGWTLGLYTVANQLATGGTDAVVYGGMLIQPLDGGLYVDSLRNAGVDFSIASFASGTVTTTTPNTFTPGQNIQFSGLANPSGGVANGTGYAVATVLSPTKFTIEAIDGHDVSQAAASAGAVTTIASPSDSEDWGALIPNGQQMQLTTPEQLSTQSVYLGFTPSRILLTQTSDAVPQPSLQFSGVHTSEYRGGSFTAGVGFQSANDAQYLEINYAGYYQFVSADNDADNKAVLTATLGCTPSAGLITTNGIEAGKLTIIGQSQKTPLADGDWVHFINLQIPPSDDGSAPLLDAGPSYQVDNVTGVGEPTFWLIDPTTGNVGFTGVNATAASLIRETQILRFEPMSQTINGETVPGTVVVTKDAHGFKMGDAVVFRDLNVSGNTFNQDQNWYVTGLDPDTTVPSGTSFFFGAQRGTAYTPPSTLTFGPGGRVTLPLGKLYGFDVGGDVTITASFNGGFQSGSWQNPTDYSIGISGSLSMSYLQEQGTSISGTLSAKGNGETSDGLVLQSKGGTFTISAGAFNLSGNLSVWGTDATQSTNTKQQKVSVTLSGITGTMLTATNNNSDTWAFSGSVSATIPGWNWNGTAYFGNGETNGLTLLVDPQGNRFVEQFAVTFDAEHIKPPTPSNTPSSQLSFSERISVMGANGHVEYNHDPNNTSDWSLILGGGITVAIGDSRPDNNGNWQASIDTISLEASTGVELTENGAKFLPGRYELDVNGPFKILGKLSVVAQSLKFVYQSANPVTQTDEQILLSGGVSFPDLNNARVQFGNDGASGGLEIDVTDGTWKVDGWRITIPSFSAGTLCQVKNFVLGFGKTTDASGKDDYEVQAGGQISLVGGCNVGVQIKFDVDSGQFKIVDIGASLRNMNPGLPMPPIDGQLTDVAFDVDGIPGSVSADILFGAVFGSKVTIGAKEYSMVQALVSGQYKYKDISITGTILLAGGTLGNITGVLDLNWGTGVYSLNLRGKMFYDVIDATAILYFSSNLDYGLFSAKLQVPSNIPIIGGTNIAEADAMYYIDHGSGGKKFLAAWFVFLGHWKYGVEIDLVGSGKWSLIGTKTINGLEADIPSGVGTKANKYNLSYTPTAPTLETQQLRGLQDDESSDSYGLMNVVWSDPDGTNDTIFVASGDNSAVQVYGPGTTLDSAGWVDDPNGGVSYIVVSDQSGPGNVMIHVAPTASFTVAGASYDAPDLYVPLPNATLNVVLTSDKPQADNLTAGWTGSFAAAAPELQSLTVTQPQSVSLLDDEFSDDSNPDPVTADNATISFQWRGLDLDSTDVSLYYDYNSSGYTGTHIATLSGSDLGNVSSDWQTVTVPWDIGSLDPARPVNVYAVIKDAGHAAASSNYAGQVQTVPAAQIQVSYTGGTQVTQAELEDITLLVTPVQTVSVTSIAAGVVTVTDSTAITVGDMFMFSGLASPVGVENTQPYYVVSITGDTFMFSNVSAGAPIVEASSGQGTAYVDQDVPTVYGTNGKGLVWPQVQVSQAYRFLMTPPRAVFTAAPAAGQEVSNVGELIEYNTFAGNNQLLRMSFQFSVMAAIAGRVFSDLSANGQLDSMDPGLAGATVFLDDNNNGVLDPGEQFVITGPDGNYLFVHEWAASDTPTTTYTTWVKVIPPAGSKITASPSIPATGITFTNDGNEQASLDYYNFMIASPVTVGGIVYDDANSDGLREAGDKGLPGITVNIAPPSGAAIAATTDSNGRWQATSYERGTYDVSVELPSGGTFTTASSMSFTAGAATTLTPTLPHGSGGAYQELIVASGLNPDGSDYSAWIATAYGIFQITNVTANPTGSASIVTNALVSEYSPYSILSPIDPLLGLWNSSGEPRLALSYVLQLTGRGPSTFIMLPLPNTAGPYDRFPVLEAGSFSLNAISYDPNQPGYSTLASIDTTGQVTLWKASVGSTGSVFAFTAGAQTFKLSRGIPVKMIGFNKAGSDHFQSQDLAVVYTDPNGALGLAQMDHLTNAITIFSIGGQVFVDMIAGDFNGNGHEDIAVLTADTNLQQYYLNILLSQNDGSSELVPYIANYLATSSGGGVGTALASIAVQGNQQALLWNSQSADGSTKYINAALVTGGEVNVFSGSATLTGHIAAISPGSISTPASFVTYSLDPQTSGNIPAAMGTVQVTADGQIAISGDLTKYGGSFAGFDMGVAGVSPGASDVVSGIVYNDTNSNGVQDPGESGLPGFMVRLVQPDNSMQTTVTSNGSDGQPVGSYSFQNVPAGSYIQVLLPPGTWTAQNPPPGVSTNSNGADGIVVGASFLGGEAIETLGFTDTNDNNYSVVMKSADLQGTGQNNLVIRASSALFVQRFQSDGGSTFDQYEVSSPAAYLRPQLFLTDINGDGLIDIVTSGQSGIDVFLNIALGEFRPYTGQLADIFTNNPNGEYAKGIPFTDDASSGVSSSKTYTHALNFDGAADVTVNGVNFTAAPASGSNYSLVAADPRNGATGALAPFPDFAVLLGGNFGTIAQTSFQSPAGANGVEQLTLTGLTPGATYATIFYTCGNNGASTRVQTVVDSLGGSTTFDANGGANLNGFMIPRTFTATSDSIVFTFFAQNPDFSLNLIALTNEVVTSGHSTPGYSAPVALMGDADSGISGNNYYTHTLAFAAIQPVTVNGVVFTPAAQSGSNWLLSDYDPFTQATSPIAGAPTGTSSAVTGNMATLVSNFFWSDTGGEQLVLAGLTPGMTYTTTWYGTGYLPEIERIASISDSLGGYMVLDQNQFGIGKGIRFSRTFVATSDSIIYTFVAPNPNCGFLQYAVTNEVVPTGYSTPVALTGDGDCGISAQNTYTQALAFAASNPVTVNGVTFTPAGQSGANWSLAVYNPTLSTEPTMSTLTGLQNNVTGSMNTLLSEFFWTCDGGEQLTLSGLTVGVMYTTTWYGLGYQANVERLSYIFDSLGGYAAIDQNQFGNGNGILFSRTFVATSDSITYTFIPANPSYEFQQFALTNQVVPTDHNSPNVCGTEIAVIPATSDTPARIYAAQQNTATIYELIWSTATGELVSTGRFFPVDHLVTRLLAGAVVNEGEVDFVLFENANAPGDPILPPGSAWSQIIWLYTPANLYATGTQIIDLSSGYDAKYSPEIDLVLAPLFSDLQTVVFMGTYVDNQITPAKEMTDVVSYTSGSAATATSLSGWTGISLNIGRFDPGSSTANVLVAGFNSINVLAPGTDPNDPNNPTGPNPNVPLVVLGNNYTPYSWNATAVGASSMTNSDDLIAVSFDENAGFAVAPFFNITGAYKIPANAGGGLYDFPVVVPGSGGGTINGNVFLDQNGTGQWAAGMAGACDGITVYLDLNNNGVWDPSEPRAFPDSSGDYQFAQLPSGAYTVAIQVDAGYTLTTAASTDVTVPAVPGSQVNGIDFGVKTKDFGVDSDGDRRTDAVDRC